MTLVNEIEPKRKRKNMEKAASLVLRKGIPAGLALALSAVACGGSASGGDGSNQGGSPTGGTATAGAAAGVTGGMSGSTGGLDTGLPGDKPISSLTDAEIARLCGQFDQFASGSVAKDGKELECRLTASFSAAFEGADTDAKAQAACKAAYDQCQAEPAEAPEECSKPTGMCTATVAEIEACAGDSAKALHQGLSTVPSCAELTLASAEIDLEKLSAPPASCAIVQAKCPDVMNLL